MLITKTNKIDLSDKETLEKLQISIQRKQASRRKASDITKEEISAGSQDQSEQPQQNEKVDDGKESLTEKLKKVKLNDVSSPDTKISFPNVKRENSNSIKTSNFLYYLIFNPI
jgi:hypothetical protein